ncbi:hypothetical protein HMPREF9449_01866 [Odoribacter laneus YIT 12061]|uniref:DUF349 domain-containing protein n=3 Tax=Odoribacter laneus TaxID=626933 RepID=H1DHY0_9BACT|nr:hypothetical protein HMPREF9449_01866 [Odoribacter laneus YIT 12061]CCZ82558.1 putative uncharacterized protein [Odoribacter laneus CAG:561]
MSLKQKEKDFLLLNIVIFRLIDYFRVLMESRNINGRLTMDQDNTLLNEGLNNSSEVPANEVSDILPTEENIPSEEIKPEIPEINFAVLKTEEIVAEMQKLIETCPTGQIKDVMEKLPEIFEKQYKQEYEQALADFTADGTPAADFNYKNENKEKFYDLYKLFKEKRITAAKQIEVDREKNLQIKLQLIEELKELVQKEEALNKTFQEFKDIQERWRNTGLVPQNRVNDLLETYHHHVENFYNYIKINKELRDLDLKRNLDAKINLCEEAEKLVENKDINDAFKQLQLLHTRWKEIGPIPKEQQEPVWERFKAATSKINDSYHKFFESLKQEQEDNLKVKEEICGKAAAIAAAEYQGIKEWNAAAQNIIELQEEWKHSGTVPQKERNRVFKTFRASCDTFFNRKREFYKQMLEEQEKNLELKTKLCEKVEAIKDSTDWKITTDKIISYQKEWKKIGPAPRKYSNKIWFRFRAACDEFFNNKNAHFKSIDSEQEKNLEAKKALIEEVKQFQLVDDNEENIKKLKEFQARWNDIGFVPIKEKEAVQEEFRKIINTYFDKLNLDEFDKNLEKYRAKINSLDSSENKEFKIINEREKLIVKIRQLENDIHTWENNIGFIAKSNKSEGLIRELTSKIEKTKQRLALLQEKLKAIDSLI